ncbi:hypothetical protein PGB90_009797 [Kerria lacca]
MGDFLQPCVQIEIRSVIQFLRHQKKTIAEIHRLICEIYGENTIDIRNVRRWCQMFDEEKSSVMDEARSGRPSSSRTSNNVSRIDALIRKDRRIRISDLARRLNISVGSVSQIVYDQLRYRKTAAR